MDATTNPGLGDLSGNQLLYFRTDIGWGGNQHPPNFGDTTVRDLYLDQILNILYDPTDGTVSFGEIMSSGGLPGYTATLQRFRAATQ